MILSIDYLWFKLFNTRGLGVKSLHKIYEMLLQHNISIKDFFTLEEKKANELISPIAKGKFSNISLKNIVNYEDPIVLSNFQKLKEDGFKIITIESEEYPQKVKKILQDNAPIILFCKGYLPLLNTQGISIVGSRDVDEFAVLLTKSIASNLALNGYNVISGYAKGVDTAAHIGALESQGTTTAILSYGVNYLSIRKELRNLDWERNTLFVTQFPQYEKFSGRNAMTRNKLVCAMSKVVVVISSGPEKDFEGKMSGTYDAGKTALQMNLPLFVLSPVLFSKPPQGNIDLIKNGGIEIKNENDIIDCLRNIIIPKKEELIDVKLNQSNSQINLFD